MKTKGMRCAASASASANTVSSLLSVTSSSAVSIRRSAIRSNAPCTEAAGPTTEAPASSRIETSPRAICGLSSTTRTVRPSSGVSAAVMIAMILLFVPRPLDGTRDQLPRLLDVAPALELDPLAGLEVLVMDEKVLDLLARDLGQVAGALHIGVTQGDLGGWHGDDLLVLAAIVLHEQHADRPYVHHSARNDRPRVGDQHVDRISVLRERVRHEAVVPRIAHRRVEEAVDHQRAGRLVHLVLDRLAADRHLDDGVHVLGRIVADPDGIDVHGPIVEELALKETGGPPKFIVRGRRSQFPAFRPRSFSCQSFL